MIANGVDLDVRDPSGSTVLMWAAGNETGDAALVDALLKLGADSAAVNKVGETALDWAARRGDTPAVAALRRHGASNRVRVAAAVERRSHYCSAAARSSRGCQAASHVTTRRCRWWRWALHGRAAYGWMKRPRTIRCDPRSR
jgi:ankyrin repeat protein